MKAEKSLTKQPRKKRTGKYDKLTTEMTSAELSRLYQNTTIRINDDERRLILKAVSVLRMENPDLPENFGYTSFLKLAALDKANKILSEAA